MDWIRGIQSALDYIESHLADELDYAEIARAAACSGVYFQRIFGVLCGIPLGEYIRYRRLTLAGSELSATGARVIDIALKYGYESPESFARAFPKFHGITPSEAKRDGSRLRSFSPLSVQIILKGGSYMDYKIVEKPAFRVLEKVETHRIVDSEGVNTIPDFWQRCHTDGTVARLLELTHDRSFIYGVCHGDKPTDNKTFDYGIAALYDGPAVEGFRVTEIPARTWMVFDCRGPMPEAMAGIWHKLYSEFFPTSDYQPTYEMDIEAYTAGSMNSPDYKSEVWIPIMKK